MSTQPPWIDDDRPPWEVDDMGGENPLVAMREALVAPAQREAQRRSIVAPAEAGAERRSGPSAFPTARFGAQALRGLGGAAREAPLVAMRAADLPADILSGVTSRLADLSGSPRAIEADLRRTIERERIRREMRTPFEARDDISTGESIGRGLTRAVPQVGLAAATAGASIPAQVALAFGAQGAQSLSEGESPGQAAQSAGLAGGGPLAGRALSRFGQAVKAKAVEQYLKALNPTRVGTKAEAQRIVPELLRRGVSGNLESLAERGAVESRRAGTGLERAYQSAAKQGARIDANQIADELESLKAPFTVLGSAGQPVPANPGAIQAIENIQGSLRELGDSVAPDQLWKFRRNVDDIVAATNGFQRELPRGKAVSIAKQARASIQKELTAAVPDVERLNSEYALWQGLEDVAKATIQRKVGQQGSAGWMARAAGAVAGAGVGSSGGIAGAGLGMALGQEASQRLVSLISSPAWRTVSAVQKARLAQLLTSGQPEAAANYVLRLSASLSSGSAPER